MTCLTSCASSQVLRPLPDEFLQIKKGEPAPFDGWVMTDHYLEVVGDAKIERSK